MSLNSTKRVSISLLSCMVEKKHSLHSIQSIISRNTLGYTMGDTGGTTGGYAMDRGGAAMDSVSIST